LAGTKASIDVVFLLLVRWVRLVAARSTSIVATDETPRGLILSGVYVVGSALAAYPNDMHCSRLYRGPFLHGEQDSIIYKAGRFFLFVDVSSCARRVPRLKLLDSNSKGAVLMENKALK
jgi:hypothetical protein